MEKIMPEKMDFPLQASGKLPHSTAQNSKNMKIVIIKILIIT